MHALPGRIRVHLAGWPPAGQSAVEARLRQVPGVHSIQANPLTDNVLINFDPTATDEQALLAVIRTLKPDSISRCDDFLRISSAVPHNQGRSRPAPDARPRLVGNPDAAGPASIPQNGWRRLLSLEIVDLILKAAGVAVSLILADSPLDLILSGAEVVRLFLEVIGRRRAEVGQEHSLLILSAPGDAGLLVS